MHSNQPGAATDVSAAADYVHAFATPSNPDSWSSRNRHLFRSETSFRWFTRMHRAELIESGALQLIAGRWFIYVPKWPEALAACARKDAVRTLAAQQSMAA